MPDDTMRGVVLTGHGGPEYLVWREDPTRPKASEVLIRVAAGGVNNTDINAAQAAFADKAYTGKIVLSVTSDRGD